MRGPRRFGVSSSFRNVSLPYLNRAKKRTLAPRAFLRRFPAPRLKIQECPRKVESLIRHTRFPAHPLSEQIKTRQTPGTGESLERSAAFSYAHSNLDAWCCLGGWVTLRRDWKWCSFGEVSACFLPQPRHFVCDARHRECTCASCDPSRVKKLVTLPNSNNH